MMKSLLLLLGLFLVSCTPAQINALDDGLKSFNEVSCLGGTFTSSFSPSGAKVVFLQPGGPLSNATIRIDDVIVKMGSFLISSPVDVDVVLRDLKAGDSIVIKHARSRLGLFDNYYDSDTTIGVLRGSQCVNK
jgi:S1-C subfamily serine protease